ncbi:DUF6304 family protein [Catellatospora vulcania]|uniref:DUF6304 family protein n=1 Tax=Catellatospora vulcania TaxID=1460450 RepID=UPI0012D4623F|nr:DUF6304 family protein [Catellatospora vulcania]
MVSWSGWYHDRHGSEPITIDSDGRSLTLRIRGVEFAGEDFDWLEPVAAEAAKIPFELNAGSLCSCVIEWDVPLPVVAAGVEVDGILRFRLLLGDAVRTTGGLDAEELTVALHVGGSAYETGRPHGSFETALEDVHRQLPADSYVKACISCAWSDYSPAGQPLSGGLACFRSVKDAYRRVRTKQDIFAIWDRSTAYVQETYLCDEFDRRGADAGYRGSFPSRTTIVQ